MIFIQGGRGEGWNDISDEVFGIVGRVLFFSLAPVCVYVGEEKSVGRWVLGRCWVSWGMGLLRVLYL